MRKRTHKYNKNLKLENKELNHSTAIESKLDAVIVLLTTIAFQLTPNKKDPALKKTLKKISVLLLKSGMTQNNTAKLLGIDRNKVTRVAKKIKL